MLLTLRTIDHKTFQMEVENSETVSEFMSRIEHLMGEENIYKVIYQGKLLKEEDTLADYNIVPKKCLILIVSKPPKNTTRTKPRHSTLTRPSIQSLPLSIGSVDGSQGEGGDSGYSSLIFPEERRYPAYDDQATMNMADDYDTDKHYVTEAEFTIALDVIISSDYLKLNCDDETMNKEDILKAVLEYSYDEWSKERLKCYILEKIDNIVEASINGPQLHAFLNDIEDIYNQKRLGRQRNKKLFDYNEMMFDIEDVDEVPTKENKALFDRSPTPLELEDFKNVSVNIKRGITRQQIELAMRDSLESPSQTSEYLNEIGFQREQIEVAIKTSLGSPDEAVEYLMSGTLPSQQENPLAFLRKNEEFRNIRVLVKRNPELLTSIVLSFGNKNPQLHDLVYENKLNFVRMINEPETEYFIPEHLKHCR